MLHSRALITGIAGFCGSHLADLLLEHGQQVAGLELQGTATGNLDSVANRIDIHYADLRDRGARRGRCPATFPG